MDAYTLSGKMITIQEPAIKSGGEGAVYNILGYNNAVAKIYLSKADAKERESKIREMSGMSETLEFRNTHILLRGLLPHCLIRRRNSLVLVCQELLRNSNLMISIR